MVRRLESMRTSQFKRRLVAGLVICGLLLLSVCWFTALGPRWRVVRNGMTEPEVRQALGQPTWVRMTGEIGAGGKDVVRWVYRESQHGRCVYYCVDFDYIGAGGSPVVYRTDRISD